MYHLSPPLPFCFLERPHSVVLDGLEVITKTKLASTSDMLWLPLPPLKARRKGVHSHTQQLSTQQMSPCPCHQQNYTRRPTDHTSHLAGSPDLKTNLRKLYCILPNIQEPLARRTVDYSHMNLHGGRVTEIFQGPPQQVLHNAHTEV